MNERMKMFYMVHLSFSEAFIIFDFRTFSINIPSEKDMRAAVNFPVSYRNTFFMWDSTRFKVIGNHCSVINEYNDMLLERSKAFIWPLIVFVNN